MNQKIFHTVSILSRKQPLLFGILVVLFFIGLFLFVHSRNAKNSPRSVSIEGQVYTLEIADTDQKRGKGLGERDSICETCGMLFVFETRGQYAFWMKDMRFPLDIIWLLGDRVVFVQHDVSPDFAGILHPAVNADTVLELNAGAGSSLNIGGKIQFLYK